MIIQNESDTIIFKKNSVGCLPIDFHLPADLMIYNLSNYAELSSDDTTVLKEHIEGLVYQLFDPDYQTQWGNGAYVLNLDSRITQSDTIRRSFDPYSNNFTKYNIYDEVNANKVYSIRKDAIYSKKIYFNLPDVSGDYMFYFIYGQHELGDYLFQKDTLFHYDSVEQFRGIVISDTINIRLR